MLIRRGGGIKSSEITDEKVYLSRRQLMVGAAALVLAPGCSEAETKPTGAPIPAKPNPAYKAEDALTPYKDITTYNNFYEFGLDKADPSRLGHTLKTRPWTVQVDGHVKRPKTYDIDELLRLFPLEERVYYLRCVEAWSMVIPWVGFPFGSFIKLIEPTSQAKYVEFTTLHNPEMLPGQRKGLFGFSLDWPYIEGLRLDEALHPLALLTVGLYGHVLPNQNGAPIRLVVPWKYGFKSIKSIVRLRLVSEEPKTTWVKSGGGEYGFYANVNPQVSHPRWSQATERRIGEFRRRETKLFNGYAGQVGSLYAGMDLWKYY
jgi:sulfoxide reductase catalytic subunit YedY